MATPTLVDVEIKPDRLNQGRVSVCPIWGGVDRPNTGGWGGLKESVAQRLAKAIKAGVVCSNPRIVTDVNGKTYVEYDGFIMARYMNADLKRLGF